MKVTREFVPGNTRPSGGGIFSAGSKPPAARPPPPAPSAPTPVAAPPAEVVKAKQKRPEPPVTATETHGVGGLAHVALNATVFARLTKVLAKAREKHPGTRIENGTLADIVNTGLQYHEAKSRHAKPKVQQAVPARRPSQVVQSAITWHEGLLARFDTDPAALRTFLTDHLQSLRSEFGIAKAREEREARVAANNTSVVPSTRSEPALAAPTTP